MFPVKLAIQETYYVDVVNLPVAEPSAGTAAQAAAETGAAIPPQPTSAPPASHPVKKSVNGGINAAKASSQEPVESEAAFNERMAKYEREAEARREEEVFKKLQNKVKASKVGTPAAVSDAEAGSRYVDYIKSRLEDALKITSSYSSRKPEIAVRLTIGADGRLVRMKVERSSGDATFELAVRRAIDLASEKFTAPPNNVVFENGFVFRPKGITTGLSR